MAVQARFWVAEFTEYGNSETTNIILRAAGRGPENKDWAKWTPSGEIKISITNPDAAQWFKDRKGQDVKLTFEDRPEICAICHEEIIHSGEHATIMAKHLKPDAGFDDDELACTPCAIKKNEGTL